MKTLFFLPIAALLLTACGNDNNSGLGQANVDTYLPACQKSERADFRILTRQVNRVRSQADATRCLNEAYDFLDNHPNVNCRLDEEYDVYGDNQAVPVQGYPQGYQGNPQVGNSNGIPQPYPPQGNGSIFYPTNGLPNQPQPYPYQQGQVGQPYPQGGIPNQNRARRSAILNVSRIQDIITRLNAHPGISGRSDDRRDDNWNDGKNSDIRKQAPNGQRFDNPPRN